MCWRGTKHSQNLSTQLHVSMVAAIQVTMIWRRLHWSALAVIMLQNESSQNSVTQTRIYFSWTCELVAVSLFQTSKWVVLLHALCNFEVCPTCLTLESSCGAAAPRHGLLTEFTETQEVSPTAQSHLRLLLASGLLTCHWPKHVTYLKFNLECVYIFKVG